MHSRLITGSAVALLLLSAPAAMTGDQPGAAHEPQTAAVRQSGGGLFGLFRKDRNGEAPMLAQSADPRVTQLEEEIRKLSGTVEELNFQVLQMQEQMRKMQEDNEFRFQELEKGGRAGAAANKKSQVSPAKNDNAAGGVGGSGETTATVAPRNGGAAQGAQDGALSMPGVELGTITVDKHGNVKNSTTGQDTNLSGGTAKPSDGAAVAALPSTNDPDELYRNAYDFILSGDYPTAEAAFRDHVSRFPADPKTADAHYWLGEAMLGQKKYRDAAEVFLAANRDYPDSQKAPDMLLKLGVSLKELDQRDVACATFKEVTKRYPNSSSALKQRVKQEQALAAC